MNRKIIVLDFGGQYSLLIARRVRELGVYCEVMPYSAASDKIKMQNPYGIIFSGGPNSVYEQNAPLPSKGIFDLNIPILGICYGCQTIAHMLGGKVGKGMREYGKQTLKPLDGSILLSGVTQSPCLMSHNDRVLELPDGFTVTAVTDNCPIAAIENHKAKLYALQFHPEVVDTAEGGRILKNFLFNICAAIADWSMESFNTRMIDSLKKKIGGKKVLCALSGGVDSAVAATMVNEATDGLTCIYVDHGLMRKNETEEVVRVFKKERGMNLIAVDASERFLTKLNGVTDPEQKRKIIGKEFIAVFEEEAKKVGSVDFLVQGTIYPDVVESGAGGGAVIKSHHNVGGLPSVVDFKEIIEPLRDLFKDEVRDSGRKLGLPENIVMRQPFPGPGLAIRIVGEITKEKVQILQDADYILREEVAKRCADLNVWQYFAVLLNTRSVGVMGDGRTYGYTLALRAVNSVDGMTAEWAKIPHEILGEISNRIINEIAEINRVVYDITSKPPATIEWE